jgi:hypothetical protein
VDAEVFDQQPEQRFRLPRLRTGNGGFEVVGDRGEFGASRVMPL